MPELQHIYKDYDGLEIFSDFSLKLEENRINCILGPSGCGKSTLLNMLAEIITPVKGSITGLPSHISYVFQEPRLLHWKTVRKNIEFVLKDHLPSKEVKERVEKYLKLVELDAFGNYFPSKLSGGMKQRASLARAFSYDSGLILMDEPFNSLDYKLKKTLGAAFLRLWEEDKRTVVYVTHDIDEAVEFGHYIFVLAGPPVKIVKRIESKEFSNKLELKELIIGLF
jgi:NitT/TauT family transport system ATP-binding protein